VLAGILITVGIGILDYKGLKHIAKVPRSDAAIMIIVLIVTVFLDLLIAVGIGMIMAAFLFMKKMSEITEERTEITGVRETLHETPWSDEDIPESIKDDVLVKHIDGPLFFGFASNFQQNIINLPEIKFVIIRMEKVPFIDQTGFYALEESILDLERKGVHVLFTGLQKQPEDMMRSIKIIPDLIAEDNLFKTFNDSIAWLTTHVKHDEVW
jgi:SulP family sulfate permease